MKIHYIRVSTLNQNTDRQEINSEEYDKVLIDRCSGSVPFFERNGGKEILRYIENEIKIELLSVVSIDRLGRNLRDILNTIHFFTEKRIPINFKNQGLTTLDKNGEENHIANLMISILASVAEMEKSQIRERQLEGIEIAKLKGVYKGRKTGTEEDVHQFLSKPRNKKALEYLKKGYKGTEAAKLSGIHINTVTKIKKLGLVNKSA